MNPLSSQSTKCRGFCVPRHFQKELMKKSVLLSIVNGKLSIDGKIFELDELREAKLYMNNVGADEAVFTGETEKEFIEFEKVVEEMGKRSPEFIDKNILGFHLN